MSRTLLAGMATHLAGRSHTRCRMLRLVLRDGTEIGITDHDKDLDFDLGDGELTYDSGTGIVTSDVSLSCGLEADNFEVSGPLKDDGPISLSGMLAERYNRAEVQLFEVNWKNLANGAIPLVQGRVCEPRIEGGTFVFEVRSDKDHYNQTVGRVISDVCDADYADGIRCHATPTEIVGTVSAVTDAMRFTVTYFGSYANDFFNKGKVIGLTGPNAGIVVEIEDWTSGGLITLFTPLGTTPAIGDTFTVRDGCGKTREDCMAHDNIEDFRGYPEVPGRKALMPAVPGE